MMDNGWIKLHRKILDWEWYKDTNTKVVFLHLLINANTKETRWKGVSLERGELIRTIPTLSKELNLSIQQIRTAINHLKSTGEITERSTGTTRVIKLCNYGIYQDTFGDNQQNNQQNIQQNINRTSTEYQQQIKNNKNIRIEEENRINNSKAAFGRNQNVYLTGEEIGKLIEDFGYEAAMAKIETESAWKARKGAEIDNDYPLLRKWLLGDKEKGLLEKPKPMVTEKPTEPPPEEEEEEISDEEWLKL